MRARARAEPQATAGGGLVKLYSQVTDSRMAVMSPVTNRPMHAYAVGAYCNSLCLTTHGARTQPSGVVAMCSVGHT